MLVVSPVIIKNLLLTLLVLIIFPIHKPQAIAEGGGSYIQKYQVQPRKPLKQPILTAQAKLDTVVVAVEKPTLSAVLSTSTDCGSDSSLAYIYSHESGCCTTKWQGEVGGCPAYHGTPQDASAGYGLCQSTPGWKMASAGSDWATSWATQNAWCTQYANDRYGGTEAAYEHWIVNLNW